MCDRTVQCEALKDVKAVLKMLRLHKGFEVLLIKNRLMLAFDASGSARRRLQRIAALPWLKGLSINIVLSGHAADKDASKALDSAARDLADAGYAQVNPVRIPGDPERSLSRYILDHDIGLLIMGAYSHSPLRRMLTGSITSDLLRAVRIPTLLIR